MSAPVELERRDGVAHLVLNRPARHNALVPELLDTLITHLDTLATDDDLRAVVLRANGRSFSTGGDLRGFFDQGPAIAAYAARLVGLLNRAILDLMALKVPLIARIQGPVTGGALGLVLAADLVAVSPQAFFAPYYVTVGFAPDGGWTALLPERIGGARAREIQLLNQHLGAEEAVRLGLATRCVAPDALDETIAAWLAQLKAADPGSVAATKEGLWDPDRRAGRAAALEAERQRFLAMVDRPECWRAMARFLGVSAPV